MQRIQNFGFHGSGSHFWILSDPDPPPLDPRIRIQWILPKTATNFFRKRIKNCHIKFWSTYNHFNKGKCQFCITLFGENSFSRLENLKFLVILSLNFGLGSKLADPDPKKGRISDPDPTSLVLTVPIPVLECFVPKLIYLLWLFQCKVLASQLFRRK